MIEKLLKVKIDNGRMWVTDIERARELRGNYYIVEESVFHRLVDGVYDAAKVREEVEEASEVYIDIEGIDNVKITDNPPYRIPSQVTSGDIVYHIDREMMVVPGQIASVRWVSPDLELEELVDKEKGI